jgi:hypothetical protein
MLLREMHSQLLALIYKNGTQTVCTNLLLEPIVSQPMAVLLNIRGNCLCFRAKAAHFPGHLPRASLRFNHCQLLNMNPNMKVNLMDSIAQLPLATRYRLLCGTSISATHLCRVLASIASRFVALETACRECSAEGLLQ